MIRALFFSPGAVQLRKLIAGGEIPDTGACSVPGQFILIIIQNRKWK